MATSKTLAPTNVTISIPAMTDAPNASVLSNCIDKEADAINALNSQIKKIQSGQVTDITLAANAQTEVQVSLPTNYSGGNAYLAVATLEFYGTANLFSPVLIRDKSANGFVCRIYNSNSTAATGAKLNWITMEI